MRTDGFLFDTQILHHSGQRDMGVMRVLGWGLVGLVLATGLACGRRAARTLPDLAIPVICTSEIRLLGCDARVEPPKCKSARVTYRRGCEEIVVKK